MHFYFYNNTFYLLFNKENNTFIYNNGEKNFKITKQNKL